MNDDIKIYVFSGLLFIIVCLIIFLDELQLPTIYILQKTEDIKKRWSQSDIEFTSKFLESNKVNKALIPKIIDKFQEVYTYDKMQELIERLYNGGEIGKETWKVYTDCIKENIGLVCGKPDKYIKIIKLIDDYNKQRTFSGILDEINTICTI